jgi:hypothetical protein
MKGFRQVPQESFPLSGLDHNVVNIGFDIAGLQVLQGDALGPLERRTSVLEPERHADIAVHSHRGGKRCLLLVLLCHGYLMVPGGRVQKAKEVAPWHGVDNLVDAG